MEGVNKVYKVVVETEDGRLVSRTAGGYGFSKWQELVYKEGEITYAPEGSGGIFVDETMEDAHTTVEDRAGSKQGTRVIYEAIPLGKLCGAIPDRCGGVSIFSASARYPAILLGKEVWRETPPRPEPKFKVGDRIIVRKSHTGITTPAVGVIATVEWSNLRFDDIPYHWHYYFDTWVADEDEVALAPPEPEWVDVTKECSFSLQTGNGVVIEVSHEKETVGFFGTEGYYPYNKEEANYRLKKDGSWKYGEKENFRFWVLKRVSP